MKRLLLFSFFFFFMRGINLYAQHDNTWLFGFGSKNGSTLDFSQDPVDVYFEEREMDLYVSNASICNREGKLLFYTNGCYIADASHQMMMNGDSLNPGEVFEAKCDEDSFGYTGGTQTCLILPSPKNDSIFYLLHKAISYITMPQFDVITDKLYYTKVNMALNNGLGAVVEKNIPLIDEYIGAGQLTAVRHFNGSDWWIITPQYLNDKYYTLLLTANGIEGPFEQQIGIASIKQGEGGGQATFSPDGNKYIRYTPADGVFISDFDRGTGQLNNFLHIHSFEDGAVVGGCAVSPNSRFLYISSHLFIYQFDLQAADIAASKITVAEYDGFTSPFPTSFYQVQLAPDCKIYLNSANGVDVLHVIQSPNDPGLACTVKQHSVQLPTNHQISMPNFPNYRLGTGEPPCDTSRIITAVSALVVEDVSSFLLYPNPTSDVVYIEREEEFVSHSSLLQWYTMSGILLKEQKIPKGEKQFAVSLTNFASGIYIYRLRLSGGIWKEGKIVVSR